MMSKKTPRGDRWDTDSMIWNAKSLQRVVKELERYGSESSMSDPFLFKGSGLAEPILLSLATEIALKAWQCRERKNAPDRTHDLLDLFMGLEPETQELLQAGMPGWSEILGGTPFTYGSLAELLWSHRDSHTYWRYLHEKRWGVFRSGELNQVLTVILNAYDKRWVYSA